MSERSDRIGDILVVIISIAVVAVIIAALMGVDFTSWWRPS